MNLHNYLLFSFILNLIKIFNCKNSIPKTDENKLQHGNGGGGFFPMGGMNGDYFMENYGNGCDNGGGRNGQFPPGIFTGGYLPNMPNNNMGPGVFFFYSYPKLFYYIFIKQIFAKKKF